LIENDDDATASLNFCCCVLQDGTATAAVLKCLLTEVAPALREGLPATCGSNGALFVKGDGQLYTGKNAMGTLVVQGLKAAGVTHGATSRTARAATITAAIDAKLEPAGCEALAHGMVRKQTE
jgi:hypothetical protein